ncbi:MAG: 30S ribosomal protein S7 [Candidatus Pacebacteria bacterium]|nr:30S ribosomal protein S7 [Candidatus Paceibacterota bacterium]
MRTKKNYVREIDPDPKHNSVLVAKLINRVMQRGKKSVARKHVYQALEIMLEKSKGKKTADELMEELVEKISPKMEVRSRRVGGASYQVPMPVKPRRAVSLALRWLVIEANKRPNKNHHTFSEKLVAEMQDALKDQGGAIERRNHAHRMAEANKAFAHFRW